MPSYMTPGVYVEEVPSQSKPIEGVGTSIAAFVGLAPYGPENEPVRCANWGQFARAFGNPLAPDDGPFMHDSYLAHAVYGYFNNGGTLCWVVRVGEDLVSRAPQAAIALEPSNGSADAVDPPFIAAKLQAVEKKVSIDFEQQPDGDGRYRLVVNVEGEREPERHEGLSLQAGSEDYIVTKVNARSAFIRVLATATQAVPATSVAAKLKGQELVAPNGAAAPKELEAPAVEGDMAQRKGMGALEAIDEITMICVPDIMTFADGKRAADDPNAIRDLQGKMVAHCDRTMDRMAILDPPPDAKTPAAVFDWQQGAGLDSKFAAVYWPWIEVLDPLTRKPKAVPPCGHVAGVWARTDGTRGVHKAPANEVIQGALSLGFKISQDEQGALNKAGINCIREFPGRGIRIWGARTLSSDPEWRYVNVRRLFNFVSESILEGTQWAVFEPNDERLWTQLRIATTNFLTRVWRDGALFGATPGEAFYVKCDAETNPPDLVEAGQVTVEVGIAPVKPAEFIVFRISQFQAGEAGA